MLIPPTYVRELYMTDVVKGLVILALTCIFYITSVFPIGVTALLSSMAMALCGFVSYNEAFSGFANDTVMLCIGMSIVGEALLNTGVSDYMGKILIKFFAKNAKIFLITCILFAALISAFISNVATTAIFIPIITGVAENSNGRITKKGTLMAVAIATGTGGICTLSGAPTQVLAQAMLKNGGYETMGFFELSKLGIPLTLLLILFVLTIGEKLSKGKDGETAVISQKRVQEQVVSGSVKAKQIISFSILLLCIAAFVAQIWSVGFIAMTGAILCIITGCIDLKKAYEGVEWNTIFTLAGAIGFAAGLSKSGVCEWIASGAVTLLGKSASPFIIFSLIIFIAMIFTNVTSNVATVAILVPIGISLASALGISVKSVVVGIVIGASLSFATPIATPPMTMVLDCGGYKFTDYLKTGGIFTLLAYALTLILVPLLIAL